MKKLLLSISFLSLIMWPACSDDTLQELMDRESGYMHLETVTSDKSTNVYFKISDSGQTTEYLFGDDGSYINTPDEIKFTVYDNISGSDDVVVDNVSELMWTKCTLNAGGDLSTQDNCGDVEASPLASWSNAKSYCASLDYGGYSDWRLPSAPELFTLINFNVGDPSIDQASFPNIPNSFKYPEPAFPGYETDARFYWTNNTGTYLYSDFIWICDFNTGADFSVLRMIETDKTAYVRCVRGP